MLYKVIGIMSGSALDGLDIAYVHFFENAHTWQFEIREAETISYPRALAERLRDAITLPALDYQLLHTEYGHYIGNEIVKFIEKHDLHHQVDLIGSHGHTTFHLPAKKMTGQLGDGAAIAAVTHLPVISDLRAVDVALGGQGAPIVPIGEKLLFPQFNSFLNLGGIANISLRSENNYIAFDVCAANRVMNMLANTKGKEFDEDGEIAASGQTDTALLEKLNALGYYSQPYPKSLANDFGTDTVYPILDGYAFNDAMRTYSEHIAAQVKNSLLAAAGQASLRGVKMMMTGGGAFNKFLVANITKQLAAIGVEAVVPEENIVKFKEALVMALMGALRWREEENVLASVTGASRNSVNGAMWIG